MVFLIVSDIISEDSNTYNYNVMGDKFPKNSQQKMNKMVQSIVFILCVY